MEVELSLENNLHKKEIIWNVRNKEQVNDLMITLLEQGYEINYEPKIIQGLYEGCIICDSVHYIKVRTVLNDII